MTIDELKKALVEVSELCEKTKCVDCPLHYKEISGVPECPLSDEALMMTPAYWAKSKLMEEGSE